MTGEGFGRQAPDSENRTSGLLDFLSRYLQLPQNRVESTFRDIASVVRNHCRPFEGMDCAGSRDCLYFGV